MRPRLNAGAVLLLGVLLGLHPSSAAAAGVTSRPTSALADDILVLCGARKGFCVNLICGPGDLAAALLEKSEFFVHALETDERRVQAARERLEATGLYGRRTAVERGVVSRLPYPDSCANLIVCGDLLAEGARDLSWQEVVRILRPGGLAYVGQSAEAAGAGARLTADALRAKLTEAGVKDFEIAEKNGVWAKIRRRRPAGTGDWSHGVNATPGNNRCVEDEQVKAPFQTLWIAGPTRYTKFGLPLLSNGRVLLRHGGVTYEGLWVPPKEGDLIQAFDAYNGTLLWEHRLAELHGEGFVAVDDGVFAAAGQTLYALNADDGKVRWKLAPASAVEGMKDWGRYACDGGVLVAALFDGLRTEEPSKVGRAQKALAGLSPEDGHVVWKVQPEGGVGLFALGAGQVFYFNPKRQLVCLDIATGKEKWNVPCADGANLRLHRGRLYCGATAYSLEDGKALGAASTGGILIGDKVYSGNHKGIRIAEIATGKPVEGLKAPRDPYCPKTGIPDGCKFMYGRCIVPTASTHCYFFSYSGTVIGDLVRNELFPCEAFRSNCRTGVIAGNGVVYNSPSGCGCALAVRGGVMLTPVSEAFYWARPESKPSPQLEPGPAFDGTIAVADGADDWPCYRHDAARSNVTPANLATPLRFAWTAKLDGAITPPAVAGGRVFVGSDNHSIYALDGETGQVRWRYRTGGEVWVTPSYWQGRVYAGSQDGWVYCLRADDGRLIWRFRGGPHDRKMLFYGRPQSLWPVSGGVIVDGGVALFYAGYCSHDRPMVYALDAATGRLIWCNDKIGRAVEVTGPEGGISPHGVSPSGIVAASQDVLYIPHGPFAPAAVSRSDGRLLWWGRRGDSKQRSNIEVQNLGGSNLSLGEDLLFVGGPDRATGSSHPFVAVDARTGRMWGADDPRLAVKAGRDETGKATNVERGLFGTKPILFGQDIAPVTVNGGVFIFGWRAGFRNLQKYLQTQFSPASESLDKWPRPVPPGALIVADDKIVACDGKALRVVSRADGKEIWKMDFARPVIPNGMAAVGGGLYISTAGGEVCCLLCEPTGPGVVGISHHRQSRWYEEGP